MHYLQYAFHCLSALLGFATTVIPRNVTHYISALLFAVFGVKMLKDGKCIVFVGTPLIRISLVIRQGLVSVLSLLAVLLRISLVIRQRVFFLPKQSEKLRSLGLFRKC